MPLREPMYKKNQAVLKDYGGRFYKLTCFKVLRTSGIEDLVKRTNKGTVNDEKTENNIIRAKSAVFELATCNPWRYWCTFTLDKMKYDRTNLEKYKKDLSQWLRDRGKKLGTKIDYLLIPELHSDGHSWHMHGFINGLPESELRIFTLDEKLPMALRDKIAKGDLVYDWTSYREKFGFNDLEFVKNPEACSKYVTKYIKKNLGLTIKDINAHMYYASKGLKRATEIKKGTIVAPMIPDYENEYVRVQHFQNTKNLDVLKSMIL